VIFTSTSIEMESYGDDKLCWIGWLL